MKFIVITQSDGKRRATEHDCPSLHDLHQKLAESGIEDYQVYCEISDLVESLSNRMLALERRLDEPSEVPTPITDNPNVIQTSTNQRPNPKSESKLLGIELIDKHVIPQDLDPDIYGGKVHVTLRFQNLTSERIRALKVSLDFLDLFDEKIFDVDITTNDPVEPGEFYIWSKNMTYLSTNDKHSRFVNLDKEDLTLLVKSEKVLT
ncbi:hypothetical protein [Leptolyngbya sp. BL0902]|uniref:hypothetical protein n=1 Tax=Leptolyngbya sp. BL0902 TaxID=1115757 RepID=UPI0018E74AE6|nr:hypothetical protein [Leptolyngbya sp. BL0902]